MEIPKDIFEKIAEIKQKNKKIIAVGTTATRTLESLPYLWNTLHQEYKNQFNANTRKYWDSKILDIETPDWIHKITYNKSSIHFETSIYITPGFIFKIVDELITNFHL